MSKTVEPKVSEDREAAVREWEAKQNASLVTDKSKQAGGTVLIVVAVVAALGAVYYFKDGGNSTSPTKAGDSELTIAERTPVQKLDPNQAKGESENDGGAHNPEASTNSGTSDAGDTDALSQQRAQLELQRAEAARRMWDARQRSAIMPNIMADDGGSAEEGSEDEQEQSGPSVGLMHGQGEPRGAQDANSRFMRSVSGNGVPVSKADQIADLEYKVLQGKAIAAITEPRAMSDLPGQICATVQRDVYAAHGRLKLIPWGSKVCGIYSADVRKGQERLFPIWNTLRRPDGGEVAIDSVGADQLGTSGMGGAVDTHFAQIFGTSALISIIGAGASNVGVDSSDRNNSASYYRESVQQAAAQTSQQVLQPYINIPPTITVPPATRITIYVNKDLDFTPLYKSDDELSENSDDLSFVE